MRCPVNGISSLTSHLQSSYSFVYEAMKVLNFNGLPNSTVDYFRKYDYSVYPDVMIQGVNCSINSPDFEVSSTRGSPCWSYYSAAVWLFWNNLIEQ